MDKRKIKGGTYPTESIVFTAVEEFQSAPGEAHNSVYVPGLTYTITPGNEWLHDQVYGAQGWLAKGKVKVLGGVVGKLAVVAGKLQVK